MVNARRHFFVIYTEGHMFPFSFMEAMNLDPYVALCLPGEMQQMRQNYLITALSLSMDEVQCEGVFSRSDVAHKIGVFGVA